MLPATTSSEDRSRGRGPFGPMPERIACFRQIVGGEIQHFTTAINQVLLFEEQMVVTGCKHQLATHSPDMIREPKDDSRTSSFECPNGRGEKAALHRHNQVGLIFGCLANESPLQPGLDGRRFGGHLYTRIEVLVSKIGQRLAQVGYGVPQVLET